MAARPPRREALATPERTLPDFGSADDHHQTEIVARPLRLQTGSHFEEPRYTLRGEFEYGGLPDMQLAFLEGAAGFRRTVVVQRLASVAGLPVLPPDALLGCHTRHPNVISALDVIERHGEHLLVLEYVVSTTLARLLAQGNRPPLPITSAIVSGILHALDAAHTAHDELGTALEIVHASVGPDNVLIGVDGTARLIHFGQDKRGPARGVHAPRSKSGYVSPEQVFDQRCDARSDIFAVGLLLWECLSGRALLEGGSAVDAMLRFISRPAPPASSFNPRVPKALDAVLSRALEPTPERRFQSAAAFAAELESLIDPASREEVARYVEGVNWSSLHEQRLLLQDSDDTPPIKSPISELWDRVPPATGSGPRASASSEEDPTLARNYFLSSGLQELKTDWKTRDPDELTKVDGVRSAAPLRIASPLPEADDTEPRFDLSPAPLPQLARPLLTPPQLARPEIARESLLEWTGERRNVSRWLWAALALACVALFVAVARTSLGHSLGAELRELGGRLLGKPHASVRAENKPSAQLEAAHPRETPAAPSAVAPPAAPSMRVLSLEELPVASAAAAPTEPSKRDSKNKRRKRAH